MGLNKVKIGSNMYQFLNEMSDGNGYTWNVIKGKCPHDCVYCYMKIYKQPELHFDESELKTDLGHGNFIFVGSSCDMWADAVSLERIERVLEHCKIYQNEYLFQSKNPMNFNRHIFPQASVLGTTIESNRSYPEISKAPDCTVRMAALCGLSLPKMVSIEPIMDFDLDVLVRWIQEIKPQFVSIGADSKGHNLPEPSPDKVNELIKELRQITTVKIKDNLKRLAPAAH